MRILMATAASFIFTLLFMAASTGPPSKMTSDLGPNRHAAARHADVPAVLEGGVGDSLRAAPYCLVGPARSPAAACRLDSEAYKRASRAGVPEDHGVV